MTAFDSAAARRAVAEFVGTAFLVATVVGSGIMATELILALQPVSAAFNPVVTLAEVVTRSVAPAAAAVLIGA